MAPTSRGLPRLRVGENKRYIVTEDGQPFFWLGDTAWELFHRLTSEEALLYFSNRQAKGFSLIQAVALAELDGLNTPNRYGEKPLTNNDPCLPNEAYFSLVDAYIQMAEAHQLYVGLLPTWGDKLTPMWGAGPAVFTPENAFCYGSWLGERYREQKNIIWVMGGDRPPLHQGQDFRPIWRAMARGIREGVNAPLVMTYHPAGGHSTSEWLHDEDWLDVNMMQSGHGGGHDVPVWEWVSADYQRQPVKPVLDGEPNYEDHPVSPWPKWDPDNGFFRDHDVRKQLYRSVFAGACGVTYGQHSIWQFYEEGRSPVTFPERSWQAALDRPGAGQVGFLRALVEARPYLERIPDQELLVLPASSGAEHARATRDVDGSYAFVYLPAARPITIQLDKLRGPAIQARWYDPRSGIWSDVEATLRAAGQHTFFPPQSGPDWVLVLDSI